MDSFSYNLTQLQAQPFVPQRVSYFICTVLFKDKGFVLILHKEPSNCSLNYGNKKYEEGTYVQKDNSWLSNQSQKLVVKWSGIYEWLWKTTKLIYMAKKKGTQETTATAELFSLFRINGIGYAHACVHLWVFMWERFIKMFNEIAIVVSSYTQWFAGLILLMLKAVVIRTVD